VLSGTWSKEIVIAKNIFW